MADDVTTFEAIDKHIQALDLTAFQRGGRHHFTASMVHGDPGSVIERICAIYRGIRPILGALGAIPFIPAKWKDAIKTFMGLMDTLCPAK